MELMDGDVIPIIVTFNEPVVAPQGQLDPSNYLILDLGSPIQKHYSSFRNISVNIQLYCC